MSSGNEAIPQASNPTVGVVQPLINQCSNPSVSNGNSAETSSSASQLINQQHLLGIALQMGNEEAVARLTQAISDLNATFVAVQGSLMQSNVSVPSQFQPKDGTKIGEANNDGQTGKPESEAIGSSTTSLSEKAEVKKALENMFADKGIPTPPPPPPLPSQTDSSMELPAKKGIKESSNETKATAVVKPLGLCMDQLKQFVEGKNTLKKTNRPEKKQEVQQETDEKVTIKFQLRSVRKSDSTLEVKNDEATTPENPQPQMGFKLRKSPKPNLSETSPKPAQNPDEILRHQLDEARRKMKMRKAQMEEASAPEKNPDLVEGQENIEQAQTTKKPPPKPNGKPKRNSTEIGKKLEEEVQELTIEMHSSTKTSSVKEQSKASPTKENEEKLMEDHINQFFQRKKAKAEAKAKEVNDEALLIVQDAPNHPETQKPPSEKPEPPPESNNLLPAKPEESSIKLESVKVTIHQEVKKPVITKPKPEIPQEKKVPSKVVAAENVSGIPVPPPPPPLPTKMSKENVTFSKKSSMTSSEVTSTSSTETTMTYSETSSFERRSTGGMDSNTLPNKNQLLSAIESFNKDFLKKVSKEKINRGGHGNNLFEQLNQALQRRSFACNGCSDDSNSENSDEDNEWVDEYEE